MDFEFLEINTVRKSRGAEPIRMKIRTEEETFNLWMTPCDVILNLVDWGPQLELEKALHAYHGGDTNQEEPSRWPAANWPKLPYDWKESMVAHTEWKASCGHHSIAAATGRTLKEIRETLNHEKGWMNPTQVEKSLRDLKVPFQRQRNLQNKNLLPGISRIQWTGPWLNPGKPETLAYRHTHYVARINGFVLDTVIHPALWIPGPLWQQAIEKYSMLDPSTGWFITDNWKIQKSGRLA